MEPTNINAETEDTLRLAKLFMRIADRENRNKVIALAEQLVAQQDEKLKGATPLTLGDPSSRIVSIGIKTHC